MLGIIEVLGLPFLICLLMTIILSHLGIHVLKREIIFIDIALAQTAAVGALAAHIYCKLPTDSLLGYSCGLGVTLVAAAFYAFVRKRVTQIPLESIIGVTYAIAAAAALFLAGVAPGGHVHVGEVLAGSILWASWMDIGVGVLVFSGVGVCFYLFRSPFNRISEDYERAHREKLNVLWWDFFFYALLGIVITFTVRIAGVVVVFAFLIIPATISALFSSRWGPRLAVAGLSGTLSSLAGLLFAYRFDFSVGPAIAAFLGLVLAIAACYRYWTKRHQVPVAQTTATR